MIDVRVFLPAKELSQDGFNTPVDAIRWLTAHERGVPNGAQAWVCDDFAIVVMLHMTKAGWVLDDADDEELPSVWRTLRAHYTN